MSTSQHAQVIYEDLPANLCAIRDRVELLECTTLEENRSRTAEPVYSDKEKLPEPRDTSPVPGATSLGKASKEEEKSELKISRKSSPRIRRRTVVAGLQRDFNILERELLKFIAEQVSFISTLSHTAVFSITLYVSLNFCANIFVAVNMLTSRIVCSSTFHLIAA